VEPEPELRFLKNSYIYMESELELRLLKKGALKTLVVKSAQLYKSGYEGCTKIVMHSHLVLILMPFGHWNWLFKYSMWNHQVEGSLLIYTDDGKVYTQRLGE
jgi:hypothetical protein